ncbi:hypothetical protein WKW79_11710 [Variovorax robiniae]|uniref:Uncharacterized protein n=1 Tax=Variovorax robiniae TaxID=1836199 RepID=A0ABU8X610_9BURK
MESNNKLNWGAIVAASLNSSASYPPASGTEFVMAKGQQKSNKEAKKPKKDTSPPKAPSAGGGELVRPTVTTAVIPRGKLKNK